MPAKYTILCVDDEDQNLKALERTLRKDFNISTAESGMEGLDKLEKLDIALIITDQRMPNMSGVEFLEKAIDLYPEVIRIILTGYTDVEDMIGAINTGRVYRYITKPWEPNDLRLTVKRAIESMELRIENKKLLENVIRLEKLAIVGQVTSGIAHEVKNQLSVLLGIQLIQQQHPQDDFIQEVSMSILTARDRIVTLLDETKNFGKQKEQVLSKQIITSNELFEHAIHIVSLDPDLMKVELQMDSQDSFQLNCDRDKIIQVLINLIRNSAHAMNKEGTVQLSSERENGFVKINVTDSGCGISEESLEKIWEPFYTTKGDEGTGLGLQICKQIIEAHGGNLSCQSQVGEGSTFKISLPTD